MSAFTGRIREVLDPTTGHLPGFIVRYRGRFALGLSCVVLTNAITLAGPWVLKYAVDDLHAGVTGGKLRFYAGLILAIAVAGGAARFGMRRVIIAASRAIEYDIRNALYAHLQRLPLAYFHANRTGDLMSRATNDLNAVRTMAGPAVMYAASTGLTFVVALAVMASINPALTLIALLPLPFVTLSARYFGRIIHERFERIQAQLSDLSAVTQEALAGVRVIRAYRQEAHEMARFRRANEEYVERNRALIRLQGVFYPSMGFFMGLSELLVLWLGSRDVMAGRMTIGELVAFNSYLMMLAWPMIAFGWVTNLVQRGRASWGRIRAVLDVAPSIDDSLVTQPHLRPQDVNGKIEFRDLTFGYDGQPVLERITLTIEAGQTVALVGRTGSGKSTLLSLLARLHDPPRGTVFIDGIDVRAMPLATLRGAIGFVPQEPFLFSDSIAGNVAFGARGPGGPGGPGEGAEGTARSNDRAPRSERSERLQRGRKPAESHERSESFSGTVDRGPWTEGARVREVATIARLDKDVAQFPAGYDTRIGERGITLSGGQKQRTAIARALYVDPRILVLDDALSAVDTHTEAELLEGLRTFRRGRTTLIVSHRISTVRDADHIVVLRDGRIAEAGTHDELVAARGSYAELHRQQLLEAELAAS